MINNMIRRRMPARQIFLLFFGLLIILLFIFSGCSSTHNYKTLSFFFDGVPNPADSLALQNHDSVTQNSRFTGKGTIPGRDEIAKSTFHPPYKEKQCNVCHAKSAIGKPKSAQTEICYQCHEDFGRKYKKVHGPVASGYCTACHNPHLADDNKLLIRKGPKLCLYCHDSGRVMKNEMHKDIADANCTECHNPHGGDDQTMLK